MFGKKTDEEKIAKQLKKINKNLRKIDAQYSQLNETLLAFSNGMIGEMQRQR